VLLNGGVHIGYHTSCMVFRVILENYLKNSLKIDVRAAD
jgi:hypothetical protein